MAAKPHQPTDESRTLVRTLAAYGIPVEQICTVVGVSWNTLAKHYGAELDKAAIEANAQVAGALFKQAMGGNVTAQIFWLKTRARWKSADAEDMPIVPRVGKKEQAQTDAATAADGTEWGEDLHPTVN